MLDVVLNELAMVPLACGCHIIAGMLSAPLQHVSKRHTGEELLAPNVHTLILCNSRLLRSVSLC